MGTGRKVYLAHKTRNSAVLRSAKTRSHHGPMAMKKVQNAEVGILKPCVPVLIIGKGNLDMVAKEHVTLQVPSRLATVLSLAELPTCALCQVHFFK